MLVKLMEGDVEGAQRLAKRMGIPFKDALAAYVEVNRLNTPSFEGGALIAKTGGVKVTKTKAEKRAAKLAKEAEGMMQKAFGAHPPAVVQRAVAQLLVADNDYRLQPNEFTKRALAAIRRCGWISSRSVSALNRQDFRGL